MIEKAKTINALLIESNPGYVRLVQEMLGYAKDQSFSLVHVNTVAEAVLQLKQKFFDIVLFDISSIENWSMETVRQLRIHGSEYPIILLTSKQHEILAIESLKDNVQDYLVRGQVTSHLLVRSIRYSIERQLNISALKKQAKKLYASESNFRSLISNNADGMIVFDRTGTIMFVNPATKKLIGDDESILFQIIPKLLSVENENTELKIPRGDNNSLYVEIRTVQTEWEGQKAFLATLRDITKRKRTEELLQHRETILSEHKTLLERQAIELKTVNQELKDFAFIISHDLKAPLRAIGSLANWIATDYSDKFDDAGKSNIKILMNRVKRMHDFIDGVLQYSRVGRIREELVDVDLNEIIAEVIEIIVPPKNIQIEIKNQLPVIKFERTRMIQLLQNLISNAVKYMDKPQGKIKIGSLGQNGCWEIHVSDNGPGIDKQYHEKIFQIFQTLQPRDEIEGTGIGLTLVKKIVEMYGGKIWLDSTPGKGSSFIFQLPRNGNS